VTLYKQQKMLKISI